jgi:hypothetical protein
MITIGSIIYNTLSTNSAISAAVGTRIFPIIMPEETPLPAIVYDRSFSVQHSKDLAFLTDSTVNITILSATYASAVDIAAMVDSSLTGRGFKLQSGSEIYQEGAFIQSLTFTFRGVA